MDSTSALGTAPQPPPTTTLSPNTSADSQQVLQRIQQETQRVRRRLTNESGGLDERNSTPQKTPTKKQSSHYRQAITGSISPEDSSIEVTASGYIHTSSPQQQSGPHYVIDKAPSKRFNDPVPSKIMSSHLKSEHEAFKARCV